MKLELVTENTGPTLDIIVGIELSAHNAVQLADRILRDGRTQGDGIFKRDGRKFIAITGMADAEHYAGKNLPSIAERVQFLHRLVESASAELARLDPDSLTLLRLEERYREMNNRLSDCKDVVINTLG